ncbi:MAG: CotH kinase family protein [Limisphaerales bacterium]
MTTSTDYRLAEIFTHRWGIRNPRSLGPHEPGGRFRCLQYDRDVGWDGFWSEVPAWEFDMLRADLEPFGSPHDQNYEATTFLLRRLVLNPEFRRGFINRARDRLNTLYLPTNTVARINALAARLEPGMAEHAPWWRQPGSLSPLARPGAVPARLRGAAAGVRPGAFPPALRTGPRRDGAGGDRWRVSAPRGHARGDERRRPPVGGHVLRGKPGHLSCRTGGGTRLRGLGRSLSRDEEFGHAAAGRGPDLGGALWSTGRAWPRCTSPARRRDGGND